MAGMPVWIAEKACPSPALSLLVRQRGAAGGIMITASHNPYKWNGMKFKASYGSSALPSIVAQVEKELATVLANGVPPLPPQPDHIQTLDILSPYLETIEKLVDWDRIRAAKFRFVVDPMHGAARGLLRELMTRHGIACDEIRGTRDPLFGGVNPEPIEPHVEALRRAVLAGKYDAGLCADGDGDRIGAMDRDGTFITPHQIFSILLWHLAGTRGISGDVAKTFSIDENARQDRGEIRPQSIRDAHRLQVHLRIDAGARHPAGRRRIGRHRHETLSARARRHGNGAAAGGSDGVAQEIPGRTRRAASRGIWRASLRARSIWNSSRDKKSAPSSISATRK